jgi:hypothetical protein
MTFDRLVISTWTYFISGWNCFWKVESYKLSGTGQSTSELYQAKDTLHSEIHKSTNSIWNKKEIAQRRGNILLHLFMKRKITLIVVIT